MVGEPLARDGVVCAELLEFGLEIARSAGLRMWLRRAEGRKREFAEVVQETGQIGVFRVCGAGFGCQVSCAQSRGQGFIGQPGDAIPFAAKRRAVLHNTHPLPLEPVITATCTSSRFSSPQC